jgi:YidC/Oxa1 family membrane protein insertase
VAVKTKYFVTAILAFDSTAGSIAGVSAQALPSPSGKPTAAEVKASLTVPPSGRFSYQLYAGPMEYQHLSRIGHEFDDVNPYGWPGFRTLIRFFAVPVRWLLVAMHDQLHLSYGLVLVVFGLLIRVLLWPLNQKAMRSSMAMQALQPRLKELQARYKDNPQQQQKEMFALYKEYKVNPLGGCWPMLLPWPVLLALFFVFQNSIELRGASFLWVPDLSRPDPLYIIPIVMGLSMYVLTKVGQKGMEPNPQMQMTMYIMPAMMTFIFLRFAAGLNLYYTISNLASIPQQWLLARERMRRGARAIAEVKTKPPKTR